MMRRQVYEWRGIVPAQTSPNPFTLNLHPILTINPLIPQFTANRNEGVEIFVGGYGSNLDIPAFVTAEQFIVVDELSVWPPTASCQLWVNQQLYFQNPDGATQTSGGNNIGIHGYTSPFGPSSGTQFKPLGWVQSWALSKTPLYIKQGSTWGAYFYINTTQPSQVVMDTTTNTAATRNFNYSLTNNVIPPQDGDIWIPRVYLEYVLFDGADSLIAYEMTQRDMPVSVDTVMKYKQMLIRHQLMADIHEKNENEEKLKSIPKRFS
jgi:hypothetical protein|tara:strand:- start:1165 stop:1956 length:792 start_codon:yes stop_codon:yes gene_type:complete